MSEVSIAGDGAGGELPAAAATLRAPRRRLNLLNVATSWTCQAATVAGGLVITPGLIRALGEGAYGSWLLINSFTSQLRTLDLGMSAGTLKFSSGALARDDREQLRRIHSSSAAMFFLASTLALIATGVLVVVLPRVFPGALGGHQLVILVLGVASTLDLLFHPQPASLRSRALYFVPDSVEIVTYTAFKVGVVLYLTRTGISLEILCFVILGESILRNLVVSAAGLWLCDWTRKVSVRAIDRTILRRLVLYGGGTFVINLADVIRFQVATSVIGFFLSSQHIAVFSIGMRLIHLAYQSIGVIGAVAVPRFSGMHETGDRPGYEALLRRVNRVTDLATAYILVNIALLGLPFLRMWIRQPWVDDAFRVTLLMLPGYLVALLTHPAAMLLMATGRLKGLTLLTITEACVNAVLSIVFVRWFGIYGVCLGTVIPVLVFRGLVFPFVLRAYADVPVRSYIRSHAGSLALGALYAVLVLPFLHFDVDGPVAFVAVGAGTSAVFGALLLVASPESRTRLVKALVRRGR
jgi:O-antigen/teichoic acid export membrane protein